MSSALKKLMMRDDSTIFSLENSVSCHATKILVREERGIIRAKTNVPFIDM